MDSGFAPCGAPRNDQHRGSMIHVCSPARLHDTVRQSGARHVVTLIKDISLVHRPATIAPENHLLLDMDDITDHIEGYVAPAEEHVGELLQFVRAWDRATWMTSPTITRAMWRRPKN